MNPLEELEQLRMENAELKQLLIRILRDVQPPSLAQDGLARAPMRRTIAEIKLAVGQLI